MTTVFEPRPFGEYLLLAQLGEDALGTVYRALHHGQDGRFARLRTLQSGELSPEALAAAVSKNAQLVRTLSHRSIVPHPQLGVADGTPYLAWSEPAGWTLDVVLARVRALKFRIPLQHALSIAERVAAGLESAWLTVVDGEPIAHGLVWPGFVSVSDDAEVRLGGFGLAEGVLASLRKPRLSREIAPYVAPEAREQGRVGPNSDVYSLGVLLLELLTGRRPAPGTPLSELRAGDGLPKEIGAFLRLSLAPPEQRFPSIIAMHRVLKEVQALNPLSASSADLALFLYNLLNPESRSVAPSSDAESTNPLAVQEAPVPELADAETGSSESAAPRRRAEDEPPPRSPVQTRRIEVPAPIARSSAEAAAPQTAPVSDRSASGRWILRAAAILAAVAVASGILLPRRKPNPEPVARTRIEKPPAPSRASVPASAALARSQERQQRAPVAAEPAPAAEQKRLPAPDAAADAPATPRVAAASQRRRGGPGRVLKASSSAPSPVELAQARKLAEDARLGAALSRIEAQRLDASQIAGDLFATGKNSELEAERLLETRDYDAAEVAFRRAAEVFRQAEDASRQERVRRVKLVSEE